VRRETTDSKKEEDPKKMDKIEGFFGTLTPLQRAINRATDKSVREANWELNLDIIDEINRGGEKK
jgi:hypothetical protein